MLTERIVVGRMEVLEDGQIQIREDTVIERDDVEISRLYHRRVLEPTEPEDIDNEPSERLKAVAGTLWTPDVITQYRNKKAASLPVTRDSQL